MGCYKELENYRTWLNHASMTHLIFCEHKMRDPPKKNHPLQTSLCFGEYVITHQLEKIIRSLSIIFTSEHCVIKFWLLKNATCIMPIDSKLMPELLPEKI